LTHIKVATVVSHHDAIMRQRQIANLAAKVRFLSDPAAYEPGTRQVEGRETHMSWVFLTDRSVYKLKKPVQNAFLDFSTVSKRRFYCNEELRLNRRLAAETYRRVVPLCRDASGRFVLDGEGRIVDWLIAMKRLPQADMLDERIRFGHATPSEINEVAIELANFFAERRPEIAGGGTYLRHLVEEHRVNGAILLRPEFELSDIAFNVLKRVGELLQRLAPRIEARIAHGAIVEGHGDLRPEHVCLCQPPQIIDCLEFNRSMRITDPYDEINYLGMECDILGAPWIRPLLFQALESRLPNRPHADMLGLYGGFRALLRARLCLAHLLEQRVRHAERWRPLAIRYIRQAERELLSLRSPATPKSSHSFEGA
jgi:aminoglycoside phosphotransferase family enzyme